VCAICDALSVGSDEALHGAVRTMVNEAADHEVWFLHGGRHSVRGWCCECVLCGWSLGQLPSRFVASLRLLAHSAEVHRQE
jgi:hypothetical protein